MRLKDILYFGVLLAGVVFSIIRFSTLRRAEKVLALLFAITLIQETVSFIYFTQQKSNILFLRLYSLIEFIFISSYYFLLIPYKYIRLTIGLLVGVGLLWYFFPLAGATAVLPGLSFLLFEAFAILFISLLACLYMALQEDINPLGSVTFWITASLIVFWSITYMRFGSLTFPDAISIKVKRFMEDAFFITNIAFYMALTTILAFYKRFSVSI